MPESSVADYHLLGDFAYYRLECATCHAWLIGSVFFLATEDADLFAKVRWGSLPESWLKSAAREALVWVPIVILVAILCTLPLLSDTLLTIILWSLRLVAFGVPSAIILSVAYAILIGREKRDRDVADAEPDRST